MKNQAAWRVLHDALGDVNAAPPVGGLLPGSRERELYCKFWAELGLPSTRDGFRSSIQENSDVLSDSELEDKDEDSDWDPQRHSTGACMCAARTPAPPERIGRVTVATLKFCAVREASATSTRPIARKGNATKHELSIRDPSTRSRPRDGYPPARLRHAKRQAAQRKRKNASGIGLGSGEETERGARKAVCERRYSMGRDGRAEYGASKRGLKRKLPCLASAPQRKTKKLALTSLLSSITFAHASPNSASAGAALVSHTGHPCAASIPGAASAGSLTTSIACLGVAFPIRSIPARRNAQNQSTNPRSAPRSACEGNPGKSGSGSRKRVAGHLQRGAGSSGRSSMKSSMCGRVIQEKSPQGAEVAAEGEEPLEGKGGDELVLWVGGAGEEGLAGGVGGGGEDKVALAVQAGEGEDAVCGEGAGFHLGQGTRAVGAGVGRRGM
ncbi:hypothetical protein B0H16DRAFT_1700226 [Mycena metata]|uniref:Uncharacterized protein n=1 Tax=Mycena metata TaxID=1033252 RepID=A0AAD7HFU8_9AGAR|nr:hypothetical protein B0H16DRAFT_1700226 [Mycena metata]